MRQVLLMAVAILLGINGAAMLGWPDQWYRALPTVPLTGPLNVHFVRDIGCAYLTSAGALAWFVIDPLHGRPAALTALGFLFAHAAVHVWDTLAGRMAWHHLAEDFVGVFLLPALALWAVHAHGRGVAPTLSA